MRNQADEEIGYVESLELLRPTPKLEVGEGMTLKDGASVGVGPARLSGSLRYMPVVVVGQH